MPSLGPLRIGPRRASGDSCLDESLPSSPTAHDSVDDLIRGLARYCAELLFETQMSAKPANDDS